ncbi:MAG TPA: CBS domain-containing protein [Candidatus Saccharimonadales bacterium]|nr:CBS domain-containing protein [Candidatus Saccharimonadales bacterium]
MRLVLYVVLFIIIFCSVFLFKTAQALSIKELKRRSRAEHGAKLAGIYKATSYGRPLNILLWAIGLVCFVVLVIMAVHSSVWLAAAFVVFFAWLSLGWQASENTNKWNWAVARASAVPASALLTYLNPVFSRLPGHKSQSKNWPKVYEKEDLLELVRDLNLKPHIRIKEAELKMAFNALTFGDKAVSDVMTPLRQVRLVGEDETAGPMLMDELHKTGFSRFPVAARGSARAANPSIIGTLYLKDLLGYEGSGSVRELMDKKVFYISETQSLRDALAGFLKTHHHLLVVVNNFEEVVGILSLEDVLEQIIGEKIVDEFDLYDDLRAVAGLEAKKDAGVRAHVPASKPEDKQPAAPQE